MTDDLQELLSSNRVVTSSIKDISFESSREVKLDDREDSPIINQKVDHNAETTDSSLLYSIDFKATTTAKFESDDATLFIAEVKLNVLVELVEDPKTSITSRLFLEGTALDIAYNQCRHLTNQLILSGGYPEYQLAFNSFEQKFIAENTEELQAKIA